LLYVIVVISFVLMFFVMSITKGNVKINTREFLAREDVQRNTKHFIQQVEEMGGKVSLQNAEILSIRAFKAQGKIDQVPTVDKRAKAYVENQKLLVTLQSRASRAYVAQKFKDCVAAIEKMIEIARSLEDATLVANYEENLAKVVRLLRRKGISVKTKVRMDEEKTTDSMEKLNLYKKELVALQNKSSKAFAEKNFTAAKNYIKEMLAIARKVQDPVLIRNYEANLRKIIALEKQQM
jgi:organic radical activating enzyme